MSIPAIQQTVVEIIKTGTVAAGGSNSKLSEVVLHFLRPSSSIAINKAHVQSAFHTAIAGPLYACLSVRYTEQSETVRIVNDALDQPQSFSVSHAGSITGDSMPTTVSVYIKKSTGIRGKNYRGSMRIYPIGESATTAGSDDVLNSTALTYFNTFAAAVLAGFTDADGNVWTPVLYSRTLSQHLVNPTNIVVNPIISMTVRNSLGHMRHRQVKSFY